MKDLNICILF